MLRCGAPSAHKTVYANKLEKVASNTDPGKNSRWIDMVSGDFDGDGQDEVIAICE
jgi:hypothetical protein